MATSTGQQQQQQQRPSYPEEIMKCMRFLTEYRVDGRFKYLELLQRVADRAAKVIKIELDDVLDHSGGDESFVNAIYGNTRRYIELFSKAADDCLPEPSVPIRKRDIFDILLQQRTNAVIPDSDGAPVDPRQAEKNLPSELKRRYELRICPLQSAKAVSLRQVDARHIGQLVTIRAMVTRVSDVKPVATVVTYTCDNCGCEAYQEVKARTFMPEMACKSDQCVKARVNSKLQIQTRGSKFTKLQEVKLQELPDQTPVGHVPRMLTAYLYGEQTRTCSPGERVVMSGVFLTVQTHRFQETFLDVLDVVKQQKKYGDVDLTPEMLQKIQEASEEPGTYDKLARSIAPEIFGHEDVKKALLLQLVGGKDIDLKDGMHIRGDLHICLMGDPGVAKSQLLRHIVSSAPRGVYTTGKGSSGVGLTAAVIRDPMTGETVLEGGALVLADMGICAIDEFDKMEETDRTAIHEVMEQQTVSIAKAGITATLNARSSVLAAANPTYGRYNFRKSPSENINLPQALLSRFDLLYLLIDDPTKDQVAFARHVTHVHLYLKPPNSDADVFDAQFLKSYISYARRIVPNVPRSLMNYVVDIYVGMRNDEAPDKDRNYFFTTARTLLSVLRLATALTRLRFNEEVAREDIDEAMRLMYMCRASLYETEATTNRVDDVTGNVYHIIRDYAVSRNTDVVHLADVRGAFASKNILADQIEEALREYSALNVWVVTTDGIKFVDAPTRN